MSTSTKRSPFIRFASAVADFGDPFYSEERQRDVWNEASAFGFQLLLWGGLVLSTAMLWFGGRDALPYANGLLVTTGLASAMTIGYAHRLGIDVTAKGNLSRNRARLVVLGLVLAGLLIGLVRVELLSDSGSADSGDRWSTLAGLATGVTVSVVVMVALDRRTRRRARQAELDDDQDDHQAGA